MKAGPTLLSVALLVAACAQPAEEVTINDDRPAPGLVTPISESRLRERMA